MREPADLLIEPRWLLPMAPGVVLEGHALAVGAGRILALGPAAELRARFEAREHLRRAHHALLPGLVNAHARASLTLLRAALPDAGAAAGSCRGRQRRGRLRARRHAPCDRADALAPASPASPT